MTGTCSCASASSTATSSPGGGAHRNPNPALALPARYWYARLQPGSGIRMHDRSREGLRSLRSER